MMKYTFGFIEPDRPERELFLGARNGCASLELVQVDQKATDRTQFFGSWLWRAPQYGIIDQRLFSPGTWHIIPLWRGAA